MTYSRAHLYGSNARMFGRAHLDKSNADLLEAMVFVGVAARQSCCCVEWRGAARGNFLYVSRGLIGGPGEESPFRAIPLHFYLLTHICQSRKYSELVRDILALSE